MIRRVYVEKKPAHAQEARALLHDLQDFVQVRSLKSVRILHRYDVEGVDDVVFAQAVETIFSDPTVDEVMEKLPQSDAHLAVEPLPGQFDQPADSAELCLRLLSRVEEPRVKTARIYLFEGTLSRRGRMACASGSPKRQLYSTTFGPSFVSMSPKYRQPLKGIPSLRIPFMVGSKMVFRHISAMSSV